MKFNSSDLLGLAAAAFFAAAAVVLAGALSGARLPSFSAETDADAAAGAWRGGKAVFSDWQILDSLVPARFNRGFKPAQPVFYSHKQHVGKVGMECQYCHFAVHKSPFAGIPSVDSCMGCHSYMTKESSEVNKLAEFWEQKKPIPWEPVSSLPEHVQFNHRRHLQAGAACYVCHGQVPMMDVVERVSSFKMGFCVSCHRENGASVDCALCHY